MSRTKLLLEVAQDIQALGQSLQELADSRHGYSVFDDKGNLVHGTTSVVPTPPANKTLSVQISGLSIRNRPSLRGAVVGQYNRGATWTLPKDEKFVISDGWVWARAPKGYCAIGRNTGKAEKDDYILIS